MNDVRVCACMLMCMLMWVGECRVGGCVGGCIGGCVNIMCVCVVGGLGSVLVLSDSRWVMYIFEMITSFSEVFFIAISC